MTVRELYEKLDLLIKGGKGDYRVLIECLDGTIEAADSLNIDSEFEDISILGV